MKKWFSSISKENLQRFLFVGLLVLVFGAFIVILSLGTDEVIEEPNNQTQDPIENDPVDPTPIVKSEKIELPITDNNYVIVRNFYSPELTTEQQEMAVIQFGSRYFISKGVALALDDDTAFKVYSCLSGTVKSVSESDVYGITVVIEHTKGVTSEYSSLAQANVTEGSTVNQGQLIGEAGLCEFDQESKCHVYFKISKNGKHYDPMKLIGETVTDIE